MKTATATPEAEARLSDLVRSARATLRRRWKTLILVVLAFFGLSTALILLLPSKYVGTASIRIDPGRSPDSDAGTAGTAQASAETQASLETEAIDTEVSVLSSPDLARDVVRRFNLQNDPEFTRGIDDATPMTANERFLRVVDNVMRHLDVDRDKLTYIIDISFKSRDPAKAAYIANGFAQTYIDTRVASRIGTAAQQADFFQKQLSAASAALEAAQQRTAQFHAASGIVQSGGGTGTINDQQIGPLSAQLATAEGQAAEARASLAAAQRQIATGGLDAVSAVRSSTVIADLRRQRAEVERDQGEIEARYGPKYPASIKVHDQLAALDAQIAAEANRAIGSLEADAAAADAQVASLRSTLSTLKSKQAGETRASATAATLDQDVTNRKQDYDRLAQSAAAASQSRQNSIAQAEIVDVAQPPTQPAKPQKPLLIALALVVSVAIGLTVVILLEMLTSGLRRIDELETRFGLPVIGSIPRIKGRGSPAALLMTDQTSMYSESLRNVRSSIVGVNSHNARKVIAITSALPDEGKSTAALSLARVSALSGSRTLLIECDVRRAKLAAVIGLRVETGLVELLHSDASEDQVIINDAVPDLDLILVAKPYFSPEDLFGSGQMAKLLAQLKERYPLIILDLPPVIGLADARTIAALSDSVVFAVRWGATPAPAIEQALSSLRKDGANLEGMMFTMVDPKSEAVGGMFYSAKYSSYYAQPV